jgi:transketolase
MIVVIEIKRDPALCGRDLLQGIQHCDGILWLGQTMEPPERKAQEWLDLFARYTEAYPELAKEWAVWHDEKLPFDPMADEALWAFSGKAATRNSCGEVLNRLAAAIPNLVGGSADLAPSNNTNLKDGGDFTPSQNGRNFHWGIREHAMGAVLNGMSVHGGLRVFGATFLIFSDYMRPSVRLAGLMNQPVTYVWTHDSIGVGEDGPTHQPVEQVMSLRMIPNMTLLRPADANETAMAWRLALERGKGPVGLALTRQKLPVLDAEKAKGTLKGAYVLEDPATEPKVILMATGSEVHLAVEARKRLEADGVPTRVVSMPSWEIFLEQPQSYRDQVLPPAVKARVSIEAGVTFGWQRWVGDGGASIGLDHFGASAPAEKLFEAFGFTVDNVVRTAKGLLG